MIPVMDQATETVILTGWLKQEGEAVRKGDVICEIETDKASVEIEAGASGLLRRRLIAVGAKIPPLTVVGLIANAGEPLPNIDPYYRTLQTKSVSQSSTPVLAEVSAAEKAAASPNKIVASPRAKRLAEDRGIDLSTLPGTGPDGRILEDDVRQVIERASASAVVHVAQAKAERVSQSWRTIPHFYTAITVDLSRIAIRKSSAGNHVTYTDYFALAIAGALARHPALNGHWQNEALVVIPAIDLGLVVQTERGLVIPVLRHLGGRPLESIAAERERLVQQAQTGKLGAAALTEPTFTLSNVGAGHIDHFTAILSPPQVAILSVGSIQPRPVVVGSELSVRPTATFTLGVDHRAIDGRQAAAFLEQLKLELETLG